MAGNVEDMVKAAFRGRDVRRDGNEWLIDGVRYVSPVYEDGRPNKPGKVIRVLKEKVIAPAPGIKTPAQIGTAAALQLARMGTSRPVTRPATSTSIIDMVRRGLPFGIPGFIPPSGVPSFIPTLSAAPPRAPPTPTNETGIECPRGTVYDAPSLGGDCDPGYRLEKRWGFDTCICEARDPYIPEGDKTARDIGLGGLESLTDMLPTLIVGGIIIAAMGMLKK